MTTDKTLVLITGGEWQSDNRYQTTSLTILANSGIGFEWASQLMAKGPYHILIGARSTDKGKAAVKELQSKGYKGTCELLQLDQTDDASIAAAARWVETTYGCLDVLINNAAVASEEMTRENMISDFNTNAIGVYFVVHAFRPLLQQAKNTARVINVSSGMGSVTLKLDHSNWLSKIPSLPYRASKAALHMATAELIYEFKDDANVKFFTVCPGFTVSNLGPQNNAEYGAKPTDEAVRPLLKIVEGERDEEANGFLHADGQYPW
jgi:NAD(P)-dependent dehydrogenase (short-subunit alcohol dehydrogenase family)